MTRKTYPLLLLLLWCGLAFTQNPIIGDIGISDPHVHVFNDTIYLYSGNDSHPDDKTWVMRNWRVFSTTNLIDWCLRETISPKDNYMNDESTDCWAGDAAQRNGKYYFYFSDRKRGIGVMVGDSPVGPFKGALGKPLVAPMHDPTILIDDDAGKTPYIIYGHKEGGGYHIAKLNNNMISLAETPKPISITGEDWENAPIWMDKNYLFKYDSTYYLSWGQDYAVSNNIYGPYHGAGAVGHGHGLNNFAHGSFFWWKGQFYHTWCRYQRPGYKFRETLITYCHFDDEGKIITDTDFLDQHFSNGVGQYNAAWPKIEAEWYYQISGNHIQKQGNRTDGFVLSNIKENDWLMFANVSFDKKYNKLIAKIAHTVENGFIEIRTDSITGELAGKIKLQSSKKSDAFQEVHCTLSDIVGKKDVYLKFIGLKQGTVTLDWLSFKE